MNIMDRWEKALKKTEIIRPRVKPLLTFATTEMPYIFLAESTLNVGDTIVREGKIYAEKPSIIMPENLPHFEGFEFEKDLETTEDTITNLFLVRGIHFPSYKFNNKVQSLDLFEGSLKTAEDKYKGRLQKKEDVHTGLVMGPEDCWQLSVLIFILTMVAKSADRDLRNIIEDMHKKRRLS